MTTLDEIFDYTAFEDAVYQGYIRVQTHPTQPTLSIANYAEKAQFERLWTPEILASRGLIYNNQTRKIIARGFPKFFNWDDSGQPYPPTGPMVLSTKFDGSLGIMYKNPLLGTLEIATRGSFASDQAAHASGQVYRIIYSVDKDWEEEHGDWTQTLEFKIYDLMDRGFTPLFEIIYPGNRIVVDYGSDDRLVLLDVINNKTGQSDLTEFDNLPWPDRADKRLIAGGFTDALTHEIPSGEEGFVLYWPGSGFRCKMKSAEYVELHRMITGLSERSVWEMLGQGLTVADIKEQIPDELYDWIDDVVVNLNDATAAIIDQAYEDFGVAQMLTIRDAPIPEDEDPAGFRRVFARHAASFPETRAYIFKIFDEALPEDLWKMAWKQVKPVGDTRVWNRAVEEVE